MKTIEEKKEELEKELLSRSFNKDQFRHRAKPFVLFTRKDVPVSKEYLLTIFYKRKPDMIRHYKDGVRNDMYIPERISRAEGGISRLADMMWILAKYVEMI